MGRRQWGGGTVACLAAALLGATAAGALPLAVVEREDATALPGLASARFAEDVAVSPDGRHVYTVFYFLSALVVWERDPTTGALSLVPYSLASTGDLDVVVASPDGRHFYVLTNQTLIALEFTGAELDLLDREEDGEGAVEGLDRARDLAISPDGRYLAAVSADPDDALTIFARDPASGELTFLQVDEDSDGYGATGLDSASGVAFSPDGRFLYVVSETDEQLTVFAPEPGPQILGLAALGTLALASHRRRVRSGLRP